MKKLKDRVAKMCISLFTILLVFCIGELVSRIIIFKKNQDSFENAINRLQPIKNGDNVTLGSIIRPNINPKIIYELRPDINVNYYGTLRINEQGWRSDGNFEIKKNGNMVRILGLGDSYMFGQGCDQNLNAMNFLEGLLNAEFPEKRWEIINTAVPGYNTVMEVETLKIKGMQYSPDIVIIEYIANDLDLPNFIYDFINCLDMKHSYFFDLLMKHIKLVDKNFKLYKAPFNSTRGWGNEADPSKVPVQYRNMVGWDAYMKAMSELKTLQEKYGFQVISLITWRNKKVSALSTQMGFYTINNHFYDRRNPEVVLADLHPSVKGHQGTAQLLFDFMVQEGIIDKYCKDTD